jgi:hypothetical protein
MKSHHDAVRINVYDCCIVWHKCRCTSDELMEFLDAKDQLIEECYLCGVEWRGINLGHEVLQVLTDNTEVKLGESREDNTCQRRWMSGRIRTRSRGFKPDGKLGEPSQGRETG